MEVIRYSNDVATKGNAANLFCQADYRMQVCTWTRMKDGMELSSEDNYDGSNNHVFIGNSVGSQKDLCFLTISKVNMTHAGDWTCSVQQCSKRVEQMTSASCNKAVKELQLNVLEEGEFGAIAGRSIYYAEAKSEVLMAVKTNEKFDKCEIMKDGDDILKMVVDGDATKEECVTLQYGGETCAKVAGGAHGWNCILKVESMTEFQEGTWVFTIQEGNNWPEIIDVELVML